MNPAKCIFVVACLIAATLATPHKHEQQRFQQQQQQQLRSNSIRGNMKPTEWLSMSDLDAIPSVEQVTLEQLENMPAVEGATLVNQIYHLFQLNQDLQPNYMPSLNEIPASIISPNGQRANFMLNNLIGEAQKQENFGEEEVTIFMTGMPQTSPAAAKATRKLVQAYMERYGQQQQNRRQQQQQQRQQRRQQQGQQEYNDYDYTNEDYSEMQENNQNRPTGNLVIINLGATLNSMEKMVTLDTERTGAMIGRLLVQMTNQLDVPQEIVHIVAQGIASHVAGAAGRQYTRLTGHKLRRITALDPTKIFTRNPNTITGLARGDAEFVDAIHSSAYGMGTANRVGDVDFYPNGPSVTMPGANNIIKAHMRSVRYYAETVRPGNERNFPAVAANSLQQYKNNNGNGARAYMGFATNYDLEGDYVLQVNAQSTFGRSAPAQKQNNYHAMHTIRNSQDY